MFRSSPSALPLLLTCGLALAACSQQPQGDTYSDYVNGREAQLSGGGIYGSGVSSSSLDAAPVATYGATAPSANLVTQAPERAAVFSGISDEQSFSAVTSRETIESDKARLAANRAQYVEIAPQPVPQRTGSASGPNVVVYALQTTNPVGVQAYDRINPLRGSFNASACGRYASPDQAQEAFLKAGGPERDPKSLDPDGDGYACYWDPTPFRAALR